MVKRDSISPKALQELEKIFQEILEEEKKKLN